MQIVVENHKFDYDMGCRMLKLKYGNQCPFPELEEFWDDIKPLTFAEIAKLPNLEERRVGINCLGIDKLVAEVKPKLVSSESIKKTTKWVEDGKEVTHNFTDKYELFEVNGEALSGGLEGWQKLANAYYIRFKDTSTDRYYLLWVDIRSVFVTNNDGGWLWDIKNQINAIDCISWTIQTNVKKGGIEKIIRQGDCILIKTLPNAEFGDVRHLTGEEYRTLLVAES